MWPFDQVKEAANHQLSRFASESLRGHVNKLSNDNFTLQESLSRLELEIENEGYYRITQLSEYHFDRQKLGSIIQLAVQMAMKNPITNRSINVQADYVFGRGVRFVAKDPKVQDWIDEFVDYRENKKVLTSGSAMRYQERNLQTEGNRFFALFTNSESGRVIARCLDTIDVHDVIRDPNDYKRELYIRRTYVDQDNKQVTIYHPMLWVTEESGVRPPQAYVPAGDAPPGTIMWNAPVLHMRFNVYGTEKFALPEIYPQIDWALAYKNFLQDWTSIIRSYARMALKITGLASKKQAAAQKSMLGTTISLGNISEKNPSPVGGSTALLAKGLDIGAVKTAGATTPASDGQPVLNMACTGAGFPNTVMGDASLGTFSTAETLDRSTELKITARQLLWSETFNEVLAYVIHVRASMEFQTTKQTDPFLGSVEMVPNYPAEFDTKVETIFPDVLEHNVTDRVRALVNAITLFGKPLTDIIPDKKLVARLLMEALNIPNIEDHIEEFVDMWTKNMGVEDGLPVDPLIIPPPPPATKGGLGAEDPSQGGDVGANG